MPASLSAFVEYEPLSSTSHAGPDGRRAAVIASRSFRTDLDFATVLFFHGFDRELETQVVDHQLAEQLATSRRNLVLIAPRLAVDRATESNPGKLGTAEGFNAFLQEAAVVTRKAMTNNGISVDPGFESAFASAPLFLTCFSAGHAVASAALNIASVRQRCLGLAFFDSLYQSNSYYQNPNLVLANGGLIGVFRKIYDKLGPYEANNHAELTTTLKKQGVIPEQRIEAVSAIRRGTCILESVAITDHWAIVRHSGRLGQILSRIEGFDLPDPAIPPSV